jgi:catechol 2,3-dioxygenase-like lactoylglutathione lyase family enzyme
MAETIAIERVDHIGIRVRDLHRALAFYGALGFELVGRAKDDVAIIRNRHGLELNLVFNASAGDPAANILMEIPDKFPGYGRLDPGDDRRAQGKRYRNHPGTGQIRRQRPCLGVRARPRSQRHRDARPGPGRGRGRDPLRAVSRITC